MQQLKSFEKWKQWMSVGQTWLYGETGIAWGEGKHTLEIWSWWVIMCDLWVV